MNASMVFTGLCFFMKRNIWSSSWIPIKAFSPLLSVYLENPLLLNHLSLDKMAAIPSMKNCYFGHFFVDVCFLSMWLMKSHLLFIYWIGTEYATTHYLNQWWHTWTTYICDNMVLKFISYGFLCDEAILVALNWVETLGKVQILLLWCWLLCVSMSHLYWLFQRSSLNESTRHKLKSKSFIVHNRHHADEISWDHFHVTSPPLQWRHNEHDDVSNHRCLECLLKRLFRWSKKTSKLRVTGLCEGYSPVTGEFRAQRASNEENISIWWRHHADWISYQMT